MSDISFEKNLGKKALRQKMREMLSQFSVEQERAWSEKICQRILDDPVVKKAHVIAAYYPIHHEVQILPLLKKFAAEKKVVVLPRISEENVKGKSFLEFCEVDFANLSKLKPGPFGIPQPNSQTPAWNKNNIDLFLVSGLAFDTHGYRLGYGKGFYDAFFRSLQNGQENSQHSLLKVGLCFAHQILPQLPTEPHDQKMDKIISDTSDSKMSPDQLIESSQ